MYEYTIYMYVVIIKKDLRRRQTNMIFKDDFHTLKLRVEL